MTVGALPGDPKWDDIVIVDRLWWEVTRKWTPSHPGIR